MDTIGLTKPAFQLGDDITDPELAKVLRAIAEGIATTPAQSDAVLIAVYALRTAAARARAAEEWSLRQPEAWQQDGADDYLEPFYEDCEQAERTLYSTPATTVRGLIAKLWAGGERLTWLSGAEMPRPGEEFDHPDTEELVTSTTWDIRRLLSPDVRGYRADDDRAGKDRHPETRPVGQDADDDAPATEQHRSNEAAAIG